MILTSVALIAVIGAAGLFGYNSFKSLSDNKEDNKMEVSKEEEKKEYQKQNNESKEKNNNEEQNHEINNEQQDKTEQTTVENKELNVEEEIAKADTDGDGVATTDEMTPELEELARQGKFQPTSREVYNQDKESEEEPKGDVGMDLDQQQKNIDAAKEAQDEE